jgi:hypothetical protein
MKKIALLAGIAFSLLTSVSSQAQVRISFNMGLPVVQQTWYDYDDDYYYMPEVEAYYNVRRGLYIYPDNGGWVTANCLPPRYNGYTYGSGRYIRVRDRAPFSRNDYYRRQYATNYNGGHRGYNDWGRRDNGRGRGWDRGDRGQRMEYNGGYRGGNNNGGNWNGGGNRTENNYNGGGYGGGHGRGR